MSGTTSGSLERLRRVRRFVLDMDGTIYLGGRIFSWTRPFLALLDEMEVSYGFLTNNNSRSLSQYVERLSGMGVDIDPERLYTSTAATIEYLGQQDPPFRRLFVLGTRSLRDELAAAGFEEAGGAGGVEPDAVVVGFDTSLSYERLRKAATWIGLGKAFIATHPDRVCPAEGAVVLPDCGSICACLTHATGRRPDVVAGKPSPRMVLGSLRGTGLDVQEVAVVGDRIYTDMKMARESGAMAVLVLSGETTREDAAAEPDAADLVVEHLGELGEMLKQARCTS